MLNYIGLGIGFGVSFWLFLIPFILLLRRTDRPALEKVDEFNRALMLEWRDRNEHARQQNLLLTRISDTLGESR